MGIRTNAMSFAALVLLTSACGDSTKAFKNPNATTSGGATGNPGANTGSDSTTGSPGGASSGRDNGGSGGSGDSAGSGGSASDTTSGGAGSGVAGVSEITSDSGGASGGAGAGGASGCESAVVALRAPVLHVLFDVSSSMGSDQFPYFSRELKWEPVVTAVKAFFSDPVSAGTRATLTFFPNELAATSSGEQTPMAGAECVADDYTTPDVTLAALPSPAFGASIDSITPPDAYSWRLGTPMLPAFEGVVGAIEELRSADPGPHAVLLVTDGLPALCPGVPDSIHPVAEVAATHAATVPTYVIGIANPVTSEEPNPPDTSSDFEELAEAGGTSPAFWIETGSAAQTTNDVRAAFDSIRQEMAATASCELFAPGLADVLLDEDRIKLTYEGPNGQVTLAYDPGCRRDNGWRFDDESAPQSLVLCADTCQAVRDGSDEGELSLDLDCS